MNSTLPLGPLDPWILCLQQPSIQILVKTQASRDMYSIYTCYWNVSTYQWKVRNDKFGIIALVVQFCFQPALRVNF